MKSLAQISGSKIEQKDWEYLKTNYQIAKTRQIDKQRFQQKKKNVDQYESLLEEIKDEHRRIYSRPSLLHRIDVFNRQLFYQCRVPIPDVSPSVHYEFLSRLSSTEPNQVFDVHTFFRGKNYTIYYIRTPKKVSQNRHYPSDTILRVIFYNDKIIDISAFIPN